MGGPWYHLFSSPTQSGIANFDLVIPPLVPIHVALLTCCIMTLVALEADLLMDTFNVFLQGTLLACCIRTLVALEVPDLLMD